MAMPENNKNNNKKHNSKKYDGLLTSRRTDGDKNIIHFLSHKLDSCPQKAENELLEWILLFETMSCSE